MDSWKRFNSLLGKAWVYQVIEVTSNTVTAREASDRDELWAPTCSGQGPLGCENMRPGSIPLAEETQGKPVLGCCRTHLHACFLADQPSWLPHIPHKLQRSQALTALSPWWSGVRNMGVQNPKLISFYGSFLLCLVTESLSAVL